MHLYHETRPLYIEIGTSGVGAGGKLLQTRDRTNCPQDISM